MPAHKFNDKNFTTKAMHVPEYFQREDSLQLTLANFPSSHMKTERVYAVE